MNTQNLNDILLQVNKLNKADQTVLLNRIKKIVKENNGSDAATSLTQLAGLGSSTWKGLDIDKYIDEERQW